MALRRDINAIGNYASVQTNQSLIAAPDADKRIRITDVIISNGATAGKVWLVEDTAGTPVKITLEMNLDANGGAHLAPQKHISVTKGKNVGVTSDTMDDFDIQVLGYDESA